MSRRPVATVVAGVVLVSLAACGPRPSTDVDFYKANPAELENTLAGCRSGTVAVDACRAASQAKREAGQARRMEALEATLSSAPVSRAAQ